MKIEKFNLKMAQKYLPSRTKASSKISGGKTLIFAGSKGMWGAAILCGKACARAGSGYTYLYIDKNKKFPIEKNPDFLTLHQWPRDFKSFGCITMGPGLSEKTDLWRKIKSLIDAKASSVVLDAQALNKLAQLNFKIKLPPSWVLTPHEGEMARLIQKSSSWVKAHRMEAAILCQKKWGCVILLKGHESIVVHKTHGFVIGSGNPALAKAGTGDVLTGIISALISQNLKPMDATALGAFIHGFIADQWIKEGHDVLSLMASDLIDELGKSLKTIRLHKS